MNTTSLSNVQSKQLNMDIILSIKKAKEKLVNSYQSKENYSSSQKEIQFQFYNVCNVNKGKENYVQKTVNCLKNKINQLENQKVKLETQAEINKRNYSNETNNLKTQLAKYIEKQFEMNLKGNPYQVRYQIQDIKQKLKKKELEIDHIRQKLHFQQQKNQKLEMRTKKLSEELEQKQKQKEKHIELNMIEKSKFDQRLSIFNTEKQKSGSIIKKLQQENITLKRQIHNIFNKDRFEKQAKETQKKSQEDYEFQLKELSQKYASKTKTQEKQIQLLRKTIQQLKQKNNESDLNEYEKQIDSLKEKNIQKQKKITIKNIQIDRLNIIIQDFEKTIKDKDTQIKKIIQILEKKQVVQKQLLDKLAKHGLSNNSQKMTNTDFNSRITLKKLTFSDNSDTSANQDKHISFEQNKNQQKILVIQENNKKSNVFHQIAMEQRSLANLKSTYKNIDTKEMSLNEVMTQIRRKTNKINELKQKKNDDNNS